MPDIGKGTAIGRQFLQNLKSKATERNDGLDLSFVTVNSVSGDLVTVTTAYGGGSTRRVARSKGPTVNVGDRGMLITTQGGGMVFIPTGGSTSVVRGDDSGTESTAIGAGSVSSGERSIAIGKDSNGAGFRVVAIGMLATVNTGSYGVAIGYGPVAGHVAVSIGTQVTAAGGSVAIGYGAHADGDNGTAVGRQATASGSRSSAYGYNAIASAVSSTAIGDSTDAVSERTVALGYNATAGSGTTATAAIAVGSSASATGLGAIAIGSGANTAASYGIVIGVGATMIPDYGIAIGNLASGRGYAVALGYNTDAGYVGHSAVAIGYQAKSNYARGVAIGHNVAVTRHYEGIIGVDTLKIEPQNRLYTKLGLRRVDGTQVYLYIDNSNVVQVNTSW